ncbi:MAG: glycosyltransferase family 2 protein [Bacteroidales bacterium]|jgi:glycosyltransferase involved in cell wall biosynthesis|nr:glycosyltransferase family 2 protein [Bacteroidales bacterium]
MYTPDNQANSICILIPFYNAGSHLLKLLAELKECNYPVLLVNDGSTDNILPQIEAAIANCDNIQLIGYQRNRGKGYALQCGFRAAHFAHFAYALTMDADGQHQVKDIPLFLSSIAQNADTLIIGVRDFSHPNMPKKNKFANRFSNFWVTVQTGIRLSDTQTGFRLYPLRKMGKMHLLSRRYEAEIELLVRCVWKGIPIKTVSIEVLYPPQNERVSHFRPSIDFLRISLLNTILCIVAIIYGYPAMLLRKMAKKK